MKRIATILISMTMLTGCTSPHMLCVPRKTESGIEFRFDTRNVNGLLGATFWQGDNQKTLWDVNLNYFPGPVLTYGTLPTTFKTSNGNTHSAKQNYPKTAPALPIPKGVTVYVSIDYQYDTFLSACATETTYAFQLKEDGTVVDMGEQVRLPEGQYADIWKRPQQSPAGDVLKAAPEE